MNNTPPTRTERSAAEADGYVVKAVELDDGTIRWQAIAGARGIISKHDTEREAQAAAVAAWLLDWHQFADEKTAYATAATENKDRDAANRAAVDAMNRLIPDAAPITYAEGLFWWNGIKFLTLPAAAAHVRLVADESRRQSDFQEELAERAETVGIVTRLHEGDQVDPRDNRRAPWLKQLVDVYRPATAGNLPRNGTVTIVDGRVLTDSWTREELALQLGVPLPETEHARSIRKAAIEEARQVLADRAAKAQADAEKAAQAMVRATA